MITYGSYLKDDDNIQQNAVIIPLMDTLAAILSGIAIFPAVFVYHTSKCFQRNVNG